MTNGIGSPLPPPPPPTPGTLSKANGKVARVSSTKAANAKKQAAARRPQPSPGQPTLDYIVRNAYESGFSDIHLGVGEVPRMRDRGKMERTDYPKTDRNTFFSWLYEVLSDEEVTRFKKELELQ